MVKWFTKDKAAISAIRKRFGIPPYTTINGWSPAMVREEDLDMFRETARRGFFSCIETEWAFNGATYSW